MLQVYCIGVTCSGKSTTIAALKDKDSRIKAVEVGKEMRRRYPPERFRGLGAMQDTEEEVWSIFTEQFETARKQLECQVILIDGQPRLESQVFRCLNHYPEDKRLVLWFNAPEANIELRISSRFPNDPASCDLATQRVKNDRVMYYDVIHELINQQIRVDAIDTFWHRTLVLNTCYERILHELAQ